MIHSRVKSPDIAGRPRTHRLHRCVQAQAGHASIESTRIYLHLTNDWLADEYRRAPERIDADADAELRSMQAINQ